MARELAMRRNVYPKLVRRGRMEADVADREIDCMQAVLNTLTELQAADE